MDANAVIVFALVNTHILFCCWHFYKKA